MGGTAHKAISAVLRAGEIFSAAIVIGILGYFINHIDIARAHANGRLVYALVTASMAVVFAICLFPPFRYSFWAFPVDIVMFIMWIVAFGLLENLASGSSCNANAHWYYHYWSFYWGRFWVHPGALVAAGCSEWRTVLAFSFISFILWLMSTCLGIYAAFKYHGGSHGTLKKPWSKKDNDNQENGRAHSQQPMTEA